LVLLLVVILKERSPWRISERRDSAWRYDKYDR